LLTANLYHDLLPQKKKIIKILTPLSAKPQGDYYLKNNIDFRSQLPPQETKLTSTYLSLSSLSKFEPAICRCVSLIFVSHLLFPRITSHLGFMVSGLMVLWFCDLPAHRRRRHHHNHNLAAS
jgi:hypothetical protein